VNERFYGRGLAVPLAIGIAGLAQAAAEDKVEASIRTILGTRYGERMMRPDFGSNLASLLFAPNTAATANLARHYVADALTRWEPRIDSLDVSVVNDNVDAVLMIAIRYRLRATQELRSLVYPFYLEPVR
jgi:phage baseplate assembly protein W